MINPKTNAYIKRTLVELPRGDYGEPPFKPIMHYHDGRTIYTLHESKLLDIQEGTLMVPLYQLKPCGYNFLEHLSQKVSSEGGLEVIEVVVPPAGEYTYDVGTLYGVYAVFTPTGWVKPEFEPSATLLANLDSIDATII